MIKKAGLVVFGSFMEKEAGAADPSGREEFWACKDLYPSLVTADVAVEEDDASFGEDEPDRGGARKWMESLSLLEENFDSAAHERMAEMELQRKPLDRIVVEFSVVKKVGVEACVFIAGSDPQLGSWNISQNKKHKLTWNEGNLWRTKIEFKFVKSDSPFVCEYKYYIQARKGHSHTTWEDGVNHVVMVVAGAGRDVKVEDDWGSSGATKFTEDEVHQVKRTRSLGFKTFLENVLTPLRQRRVEFLVHARTAMGDVMYVCGSIPELGNWQRNRAVKLKYGGAGEGADSVWGGMVTLEDERMQFEYKYFILKQDGSRIWEKGADKNRQAMTWMKPEYQPGRILFEDKFECNSINFSIFYPAGEHEVMHVTGEPAVIGKWMDPGPVPMRLGVKEKLETDVEGQKWELSVFLSQETKSFQYRYALKNTVTGYSKWEREPNRVANLNNLQPVNSTFFLRDVNFVADMQFHECPPDMFIGPYPQTTADIDEMAEAGVTAVLNVQTDEDFDHRQIDWDTLLKHYEKRNIQVIRCQIRDFDRNSLRERLMSAVRVLDVFHMEGKKSYIHCTAGMGRAPAVVVAYLVWVKKWNLYDAVQHVKTHRPVAVPNVPVLEEALKSKYTLY